MRQFSRQTFVIGWLEGDFSFGERLYQNKAATSRSEMAAVHFLRKTHPQSLVSSTKETEQEEEEVDKVEIEI